MRTWAFVFILAISVLASASGASAASPLTGTYNVTITGKPAPLNGKWRLEFLPRNVVDIFRNGKVVVVSKAAVSATRLKLTDRSGPYACSPSDGTGTYTYKLAQRRLTFKPVADTCVGRKLILTAKPFLK